MDVARSSAFTALALSWLLGCGAPAARPAVAQHPASPPAPAAALVARAPDPDLHRPPPRRLVDLDWDHVALTTDAEALEVWRRIAPTGTDWDDKLGEVPATAARPLALALLRGGNFTCARPQPATECARPAWDVPSPADGAGFDDACLRRLLALWALAQLEYEDAPKIMAELRTLAAIPPPESQLVAAAIHAVEETEQDARLELLAIASHAGQRELVDAAVGSLDEPHLIEAARRHHLAGALEVLSAEGHRTVYLAAVTDDALDASARVSAIGDLAALADRPPPDLQAALVAATKAKDCTVAAAAARALDQHGDHRFVPRRPHTSSTAVVMRSMCVLASYEAIQHSDETSVLSSYLPARGLERVTITYDPLSEDDSDGNGDPHTTQTAELVPRSEAVLPELADLVKAMQHCTGAICVSEEHEFRFVWRPAGGELLLTRLELADRPPCPEPKQKP